MADDQELWATMGMPMSFGKQTKKKTVNRNFDQMKRSEVSQYGSQSPNPTLNHLVPG